MSYGLDGTAERSIRMPAPGDAAGPALRLGCVDWPSVTPLQTLPLLVTDDSPETRQRAATLARELDCPVLTSSAGLEDGLALALGATRLELIELAAGARVAVSAEFVTGRFGYRLRQGFGRRQPLGRAVGLVAGHRPRVVDATAGLGRDSVLLASLGCAVRALERSAVVAALLQDGLRRAGDAGRTPGASLADTRLGEAVERIELIRTDARQWLTSVPLEDRPEVVFLDPMFPERHKSAMVRKEMRLFRELVGEDLDADDLLAAALASAAPRIVVKRPRGAPAMGGPRCPSHSHSCGVTRYDVYLQPAGP